jgi:hypothetical protein
MLSLSDTATLLVKRVAPSGGLSNYKILVETKRLRTLNVWRPYEN